MITVSEDGRVFYGQDILFDGGGGGSSKSTTETTNVTVTETTNNETNIVETTTINEASITGEDLSKIVDLFTTGAVQLTNLGDGTIQLHQTSANTLSDFSSNLFNFAEDFGEAFFDFNTRSQATQARTFQSAFAAGSGRDITTIVPEPDSDTGKNLVFYSTLILAGIGIYSFVRK